MCRLVIFPPILNRIQFLGKGNYDKTIETISLSVFVSFSLIYKYSYSERNIICMFFLYFIKAPSQRPANIAWKLSDSKICLNWEHVKTMANESEVLGYKVST